MKEIKRPDYPSDLFLRKMQVGNELLYLAMSMQDAIDSGRLSGKKLHEASRKLEIITTASEFLNECFYRMEALHRALCDVGYNLAHESDKVRTMERNVRDLQSSVDMYETILPNEGETGTVTGIKPTE